MQDPDRQMKVWIENHGSERLNLAYESGYKCENSYYFERAEFEFPEFQLKTTNMIYIWDDAPFPSLQALKLAKQFGGVVKNVYTPVSESERSYVGEAVVIENWLRKFTLFQFVSDLQTKVQPEGQEEIPFGDGDPDIGF
ncbi:hypothetical protein D3C86_1768140 [compost metagenome]